MASSPTPHLARSGNRKEAPESRQQTPDRRKEAPESRQQTPDRRKEARGSRQQTPDRRKEAPGKQASPPRTTAAVKAALAHLRASDPVLSELIDACGSLPSSREGRPDRDDHYGALVRSIVGQQLSVKAARSIYGRLTDRYGGRPPTPEQVLAEDPDDLRTAAGLSRAKVGFLRSLAEHVQDGRLELARLDELPDELVVAELVAVKGLGVWTAHMFLMFHLERPDVLAVGDLGIRRAVERAYGLPALPSPEQLEAIAAPWSPHRTLACRYLWRSLANEPG